jgi:ankyrin repeat protein
MLVGAASFTQLNAVDMDGNTALHLAAEAGARAAPVPASASAGGGSGAGAPVGYHVYGVLVRIVQKLVRAGCDLTIRNADGRTPRQLATHAHAMRSGVARNGGGGGGGSSSSSSSSSSSNVRVRTTSEEEAEQRQRQNQQQSLQAGLVRFYRSRGPECADMASEAVVAGMFSRHDYATIYSALLAM